MIFLAILIISIVSLVHGHGHGKNMHGFVHSTYLDAAEKFHLAWNFNKTHIMFEVQVQTRGWVGLGFSTNGGMLGADIVIGWVDDTTGETFLQDRHATSKSEPVMDKHQNYTLLGSAKNESFTVLQFIRPLNLCSDEDFEITEDTARVIWAYNDMLPGPNMGPRYHGQNRGVRSIILLNPQKSRPPVPENSFTIDLMNRNVMIPGDSDTTYWCRSFEIPKLNKKHHIIKIEPVIQLGREAQVHHIVLYACKHEQNTSVGVASECFQRNMPPDWKDCISVVFAWAIGGGDFYLPEHVGLPIGYDGPESPTMFLLQTHYDNPDLIYGMEDSSGLRLTLTPELRQHDAGVIDMGVGVWRSHVIPPHYKEFISQGLCTDSCLSEAMGSRTDEVNVFALMLHSHLAGRKLRLRHFRGGVEQKPILEDNNYDFNLQETRHLLEEIPLKKGDHTIMQCHYNTESRSELSFGGEGTTEEMCIAFVMYYPKIPLTLCATIPLAQSHVAFVEGATADDLGNMVTPEEHRGERWDTFLSREVDWKDEAARKAFQKHSLTTSWPAHFSLCSSGGNETYPASNYKVKKMPEIWFPWKGNNSMCMTAGANQRSSTGIILTILTTATSFLHFFIKKI